MNQPDEYEFIDFQPINDLASSIDLNHDSEPAVSVAIQDGTDRNSLISRTSESSETILTTKEAATKAIHRHASKQLQHPKNSLGLFERIACVTRDNLSTFSTVYRDHDPLTGAGRSRIRNFVLSSGPAYHLPRSVTRSNARNTSYTGWRMGALLNLILLVACLVAEVAMLVIAIVLDRRESDSWLDGVLYSGSCQLTKRWSTPVSLLINIIATITIGSSNYMMQCLSAPSGPELSKAHEKGSFVQIGVSSPSNIAHLSRTKTILWWVMGITSVPVHLLFNSAFFATLQANDYAIALFTEDYPDATLWSDCANSNDLWSVLTCDMYQNATNGNQYERLDNAEACIRRYSDPLINQYSNVILVSSVKSTERNQTLEPLWNQTRTIDNSTFDFTKQYHTPTSMYSLPRNSTTNSTSPSDLPALLGIFSAYDYSDWDLDYRKTLNATSHRPNATFDPTGWLCHDNFTLPCSGDEALVNSTNWRVSPYGIPISYCLSQKTPVEMCQLRYSSIVLGIVIGCDVLKIFVIAWALRSTDRPLVTIGDVINYLLQNPEKSTEKRCLLDQKTAEFEAMFASISDQDKHDWTESCFPIDFSKETEHGTVFDMLRGNLPITWEASSIRWFRSASWESWAFLYLIILSGIGACATTFGYGLSNVLASGGGSIWTRGLLSPDPNAIFTSTASANADIPISNFLKQVLIINSPQLFFSMMYFAYNRMFTAMHAAQEWSRFAKHRKPLRVSEPEPGQRSTYWLNLPWGYSLFLITISALLHWLVSRSLYLVNINVYGADGFPMEEQNIFACGFSTVTMVCVLAILVILVAIILGFSLRRLPGDIPLVGTSSIAISAACHHPNDPKAETCKPLLWGVTRKPEDGNPGHCALSSGDVERPVPGLEYQ